MLTYADEEAVLRLHMQVEEDIKGVVLNDAKTLEVPKFIDRDNILDMPSLSYDDRFKSNVTQVVSTVKVPQGVYQRECGNRCEGGLASLPQDARKHIKASDGLESRVMKANLESDSSIRWQYVGFQSGVFRQVNYPYRHLNQSCLFCLYLNLNPHVCRAHVLSVPWETKCIEPLGRSSGL